MSRRDDRLDVYTVTFHPPDDWLGSARHHDMRMELTGLAVDAIDDVERPLILFPAGFLRAVTTQTRDQLAESLLELSRASEVGLVFGVDVAPEDGEWAPLAKQPDCYGFACDSGQRRLWPIEQHTSTSIGKSPAAKHRVLELCGWRVAVLISAELFNVKLREQLEGKGLDLIVLLTHNGPTDRWQPALDKLNAIAPVIMSGEMAIGELPLWAQRPTGWIVEPLAQSRSMSLYRHRRIEIDPNYDHEDPSETAAVDA